MIMQCDGIDDEIYEALSNMPNLCYECPDCRRGEHSSEVVRRVKVVPFWVEEEKKLWEKRVKWW